jgi:dCMP deaminase
MGLTWDEYFMNIAKAVSLKSHCLSRQIGAITVRNKYIVSTGYNGPPVGYPHCSESSPVCPRKIRDCKSGEGLEICPSCHAEINVLIEASRLGLRLEGCSLYLYGVASPCRECSKSIVNAGIIEIIVSEAGQYPDIGLTGIEILSACNVNVRKI